MRECQSWYLKAQKGSLLSICLCRLPERVCPVGNKAISTNDVGGAHFMLGECSMKIGYARVSTDEQRLDLQVNALKSVGCGKIFIDQGFSGVIMARPGLERALKHAKTGSTLVVWRLDRLGRSLSGLVRMIENLGNRGVDFASLTEAIDTTHSSGRLLFHIMAAMAEFERSLISERTRAGMQAARSKGVHLGRPKALSDAQILVIQSRIASADANLGQLASEFGVSLRTLKRLCRQLSREE